MKTYLVLIIALLGCVAAGAAPLSYPVFRTPAGVVIVAPGEDVEVTAATDVLLAVAAAPGGDVRRTAVVDPGSILVESRGSGPATRMIKNLLPPSAEAGRLIAVEAYTPGGNWSSYPPHKHDTNNPPDESQLEELYFYRFARPTGSASPGVPRSLPEVCEYSDVLTRENCDAGTRENPALLQAKVRLYLTVPQTSNNQESHSMPGAAISTIPADIWPRPPPILPLQSAKSPRSGRRLACRPTGEAACHHAITR